MKTRSHLSNDALFRPRDAVLLLIGAGLALAGCGNSTPQPAKVPEVPIATAAPTADPAPDARVDKPTPPPVDDPKVDKLLGRSKEHAIDVCGPPGQRAYLASLRCTDGRAPTFGRTGNVGARHEPADNVPESVLINQMDPRRPLRKGEIDYHIVDLYKVVCSDGEHSLYLDMYHCTGAQTSSPPSGFTMEVEGGV